MAKLTEDHLIKLCREHHWMSIAGKEEWENLLRKNEAGKPLKELAKYIWRYSVEAAGTSDQIWAGLIAEIGRKEDV